MQKFCSILAVLAIFGLCALPVSAESQPSTESSLKLRFHKNKQFKIVQFTDTQDDQEIDPRTVALMEAVLDDQKPDLVVFTGDNINGGPKTSADVAKAIENIIKPVEDRAIPWLATFGNHDEDHLTSTGVDEAAMLDIYMAYAHNLNRPSPKGVDGTGNMNVLITSSKGNKPAFNIWALDSGRYAPEKIADQALQEDFLLGWTWMPGWDWLKPSQIAWYRLRSASIEKNQGKKIPALMFFHIPLQEFRTMYENHLHKVNAGLADQHGVIGERHEDECPGPFNSGLFSAILERGDVKGVFVGHDHVNNYVGNYFGVVLGYSANTGFGTYGLEGTEKDRLRGARVFVLDERNLSTFDTYMVYAKDYGIQ